MIFSINFFFDEFIDQVQKQDVLDISAQKQVSLQDVQVRITIMQDFFLILKNI